MQKTKPKHFFLDVDGVMTTGHFIYSHEGKQFKIFGPDDNDALCILKPYLNVSFVTGDRKGFAISQKRIVDDMGFPLELISTVRRAEWMAQKCDLSEVIYMGDGIFDHFVAQRVAYSIAPANASPLMKRAASFVTEHSGGDRAVAEACLHILDKFFEPFNPDAKLKEGSLLSGEWQV